MCYFVVCVWNRKNIERKICCVIMQSSYVFEHLINAQLNINEQQQKQQVKEKPENFEQIKEKSLKFCNQVIKAFKEVGAINKQKKLQKN